MKYDPFADLEAATVCDSSWKMGACHRIPSHWFGLEQRIEIGPMSGKSNVVHWLERHGIAAEDGLVARILEKAKRSDHVLEENEILAEVGVKSGERI